MPLLLLNKPFGVLSAFQDSGGRRGLGHHVRVPRVYPAGRLDADSEGLLLLTDDGRLQSHISHPRHKLPKRYLVQVEGEATESHVRQLLAGVVLGDGAASARDACRIDEPQWLWPRIPPVRFRRTVPTSWMELELDEGRNRQVRRMTAAVGLPTLRLVRTRIGPWSVNGLAPGESRRLRNAAAWRALREGLGEPTPT